MKHVWVKVEWTDGNYSMDLCAAAAPGAVMIATEVWERYEKHRADARFWHDVIRHIDKEG